MDGYCTKCQGMALLALGVLVFLNLLLLKLDWWLLAGVVLVLGGTLLVIWPHCRCGRGCSIGPLPKDADERIAAKEKELLTAKRK